MMPEKTSNELLRLERSYWDAIKERDVSAAKRLSDEPCLVVGAQGVGKVDRKALGDMLEGASWELTDYSFDDFNVQHVAEGVAVVAYRVKEKLVVDGKAVDLEAFDSSVWVQRDGRWLCTLHTESPAGDPFGRN